MKHLKRLTAALLALLMVLGLAACGSAPESGTKTQTDADTQSPAQSAQGTAAVLEPGMVQVNYRAAEVTPPDELSRVEKIAVSGGTLYAVGMDEMTPVLFAMDLETESWTQLGAKADEPETEGAESAPVMEFRQIGGLAASDERVFLLMSVYGETGMRCEVETYDAGTGEALGSFPLETAEVEYFRSFFAVGDKLAALGDSNTVYIYSQEGELLCTSKDWYDFVMLADGKLLVGKNDEQGETATVFELNVETGESTELCRVGHGSATLYVSEGGTLLAEGNSVYSLDLASGKTEHLFDWGDTGAGIMLSPDSFFVSAAGDFFIADSFANAISRIRYFEGAPRRELVIGVGSGVAGTYLTKAVSKFNATSTEYLARVQYYKQEEADKILTELIAGKGPDVLFLGSSTDRESAFTRVKVDSGLCVDLTPYLENDPDVSPEDFVPGVLESMTEDGQLYKLAPSFQISSVAAPKEIADGLAEWTPEALTELANTLPEEYTLFNTFRREFFLEDICALASVRWVDRANGNCSFDTGEFGTWLELCKNMEYIGDGNVEYGLLIEGTVTPSMASYFKQVMGDYEIIGYPSAEGIGSGFFGSGVGGFSILKSSSNPDGAWQFIKTLLTPEVQQVLTGFECPAIQSSFDKCMDKWVESMDMTEEDVQKFLDALADCHGRCEGDAVTDIITEEAQKYFADQRSLEDTVAIIQSRAGIYLAEQKG